MLGGDQLDICGCKKEKYPLISQKLHDQQWSTACKTKAFVLASTASLSMNSVRRPGNANILYEFGELLYKQWNQHLSSLVKMII